MTNKNSEIDLPFLLEQTGWLQALARGLVNDSHRAEDLTQDTLLAAVEKPPRLASEPLILRAWLAQVARRLAYSSARAKRHRDARENDAAHPERQISVAEAIERTELRQRVTAAILELDTPYRDVVVLRYFEGLPTREVAVRTGASEVAVRTRLSRALAQLRARLDESYDEGRPGWMVIALPLAQSKQSVGVAALSVATVALPLQLLAGLVLLVSVGALSWMGYSSWRELPAVPTAIHDGEFDLEDVATRKPQRTGSSRPANHVGVLRHEFPEDARRVALRVAEPGLELRVELTPTDPEYDQGWRDPDEGEESRWSPPKRFALEAAWESMDNFGWPAIQVRIGELDQAAFTAWTSEMVGRKLAVVLDQEVLTRARIKGPLGSQFVIEGGAQGFTRERLTEILTRLGFPVAVFEPYAFFGVVVDADSGAAIESARIFAGGFPSDKSSKSRDDSVSVRSDAQGRFQLQVESPHSNELLVEAEGFGSVLVPLAREYASPESALVVDLVKSARLSLRVLDENRAPISNASIRIVAERWSLPRRPRWSAPEYYFGNENEQVVLVARDGSVGPLEFEPQVRIHIGIFRSEAARESGADAWHQQELVLAPGEERSLEVLLAPSLNLHGRVVGPEGQPVPRVEVRLTRFPGDDQIPRLPQLKWSAYATTVSDDAGRFRFEGVPEGPCQLAVNFANQSLDGIDTPLTALTVPVDLNSTTSTAEVVITMEPARPIRGVVVDGSGNSLHNQIVAVHRQEEVSGSWWNWAHTNSDARGEFHFLVPAGHYLISTDFMGRPSSDSLAVDAGDQSIRLVHSASEIRVGLRDIASLHETTVDVALYRRSKFGDSPITSRRFEVIGANTLLELRPKKR